MKKQLVKFTVLLLSVLMLLPAFSSCNKKKTLDSETEDTTKTDEVLPVQVADFGGEEFNIFAATNNYGYTMLNVDEENGITLDSAVMKRNRLIENRLNMVFKVREIGCNDLNKQIQTICMSGVSDYDLFYQNSHLAVPQSTQGFFASNEDFSNVDFSQSWWDQTAVSELSINGKTYDLIGTANIHFYESICIMAYNKDVAELWNIDNLAQKALDGDWTFEDVYTYSTMVAQDKDNSSSKSEGDFFGFATGYNLATTALFCSGETILEYDADNYPSFSGFSERCIDIFDNIRKWFFQSDATFVSPGDNGILSNGNTFHDVFKRGDALFYFEPIGSLQKLRDVSFEFTVLPVPKYSVEDKYTTSIMYYAFGMFVPACKQDKFEQIGIVLDNMMYESERSVLPVYLDSVVSLQRVRNEDSWKVLNQIVLKADRTISPLLIYDWGGLGTSIRDYAVNGGSLSKLGASLSRTLNGLIEESIGKKQ